jgi:hypothetical protein
MTSSRHLCKLDHIAIKLSNSYFAKFGEAFVVPWLGVPTKGDYEDGV